MTNVKTCEECGQTFYRQPTHRDHNWRQKRFCCGLCSERYAKKHGTRGNFDPEPDEEEIAQIELRKIEVRQAVLGHLVDAGDDDKEIERKGFQCWSYPVPKVKRSYWETAESTRSSC